MTTQAAQDYLTKEVFIRKSVVTFRSLSRELGIHVDDAKNELKAFYQASTYTDTLAVPTYLVSGEVTSKKGAPSNAPDDYDMDLDFEDENRLDVVNITKVVLVDAEILDVAQYSRIFSVHVYSLSPSKLKDADLICASNVNVQKVDASRGPESFPIVGKIRGAHVEVHRLALRHAYANLMLDENWLRKCIIPCPGLCFLVKNDSGGNQGTTFQSYTRGKAKAADA
ncbi:DNA polymerase subunit Cdc27-domain-containing protein [Pisolithus croceorrhizus]|nr:DNA polymerase subunit Cdc27-domain-containing protein [Pisolithus croceorrhizus]